MSLRAQNEYRPRMNGEWGYYAYLLGICLMFLLRDVLQVSIPLALFLGYFAIGYMIFDYDHCLALSAMLPLLHHGVQTNYIILIAAVLYVFRFGVHIRLNMTHGILIFLMAFELMHLVYQPFSFAEYLRYVVQYAYLALVLGDERLPQVLKNPGTVLTTFVFMAAYFMLDVLLVTARYIPLATLLSSDFRFGTLDSFLGKQATLYDNEIIVGLFSLTAINVLMIMIINSRKHMPPKLILMAFFMYFGFLTSSRAFLLCLAGTAVLYLGYMMYVSRKSLKTVLLIIVGAAIILVVVTRVFFADAVARVVERFNVDDITTGRDDLFRIYNEFIVSDWKHLLFGVGLQNIIYKTGAFNSCHNGTQEIVVCWGLVGLVLMICLLVNIWKRAKRVIGGKIKIWYYIPIITYLVYIQSMQFVRLTGVVSLMTILYITLVSGGKFGEQESIPDNS